MQKGKKIETRTQVCTLGSKMNALQALKHPTANRALSLRSVGTLPMGRKEFFRKSREDNELMS
jgi:hypothetical protein